MNYQVYGNELYHHGILGQKWGVRRYQNPDGSLTPAGVERYQKKNYRIVKEYSRAELENRGSKQYHKAEKNFNELLKNSITKEEKNELQRKRQEFMDVRDKMIRAEDKLSDKVFEKDPNGDDFPRLFNDALKENPKLAKDYYIGKEKYDSFNETSERIANKILGSYGDLEITSSKHESYSTTGKKVVMDAIEWDFGVLRYDD